MPGAHEAVGAGSGLVVPQRAPPPVRGEMRAVGSRAGASAPPIERGSGAVSARVQQERGPRNRRGESGHFAKHDLDDVPDGVGRILGSAATTQSAIDEELKQIESERPEKQDSPESILCVPEDVAEVPVSDPLMKSGVLDMPTRPDDP
jgi:hypothetical protein